MRVDDGARFRRRVVDAAVQRDRLAGLSATRGAGGLDPDERDAILRAGWRPASLGPNVLRFETAAVAALAIVRSLQW